MSLNDALANMNDLYNKITDKGMDIYQFDYSYSLWKYHRYEDVTDIYTILLPKGKKYISEDNIERLKGYDKKIPRTSMPLKDIVSGRIKIKPVKEMPTLNTLRELISHGVHFSRR
ncbi:MAG: hypothetical protein ABIB43_04865 [archaeon]